MESSTAGRTRAVRIATNGEMIKTPTTSSFMSRFAAADNNMDETNSLLEKLQNVKEELQITQESFISRERSYKIRIDELENMLAQKRKEKIGWMDTDPKITALKKKQAQILSNVALVQDRFSRIVLEQEQDLLKAFQARLLDVQAELEMQKSKKDDGAVAYIELSKAKEYDVEKEKVKADLKERQNQALLQANNRLKSQFVSREEDRNYLVMQINMARNDNARLRNEYNEHENDNKRLKSQVCSGIWWTYCSSVLYLIYTIHLYTLLIYNTCIYIYHFHIHLCYNNNYFYLHIYIHSLSLSHYCNPSIQLSEQAERLAAIAQSSGGLTFQLPGSRKNLTSAQALQLKLDSEERWVLLSLLYI